MLAARSLAPDVGLAVHAFTAPVAPASALAADAVVSWSSNDLTVVGIGIARELRGHGASRWTDIVDAARAIACDDGTARATAFDRTTSDGMSCAPAALGFARPRFLGGAAFAPGAADRAPWHGFGDAWFVLPRWSYVSTGREAKLVLVGELDATAKAELEQLLARLARPMSASAQPALVELQPARADEWREQVTSITNAIARGECSKVVAARTCNVLLAGGIDLASVLAALDDRHRDCVRVMMRPSNAALVAATPERLVRLDGRSISCDALAGTISSTIDAAEARLLASTKDRREHDLVVDAIRTALEAAGATIEGDLSTPGIRALRHVLHLHTPFRAQLREPRHVLELVARLHPTPAVGGTPTPTAIDWIASREPAARGWYASPVGWFDFDGNGEFAVAIRSGVIADHRAHLWAGAGIVAGSDPDRELAETDAKFRAMLGALGIGGTA